MLRMLFKLLRRTDVLYKVTIGGRRCLATDKPKKRQNQENLVLSIDFNTI